MIAQDVDHGLLWKGLLYPADAILAGVNITGEHHDVCISARRLER
jgi:hypothetical protein